MATITIDDAELRELVRKHAQRAAAEYITNRTIPSYPTYFFEAGWLVTYDWAKYLADLAEQRAVDRIKASLPRWLRWLIR